MDSYEIINYIATAPRKTPVKVYLKGQLAQLDFSNSDYFGDEHSGILFCEWCDFMDILKRQETSITKYIVESDRRNSAIPLLDLKNINARIEPGAMIREMVEIGDNCVIMMGAVVNIGAVIGKNTMIDMNTVIGGRAMIGANCHIGAGAVVAGVIEPPSADPVIIEDNVLVGANAVILEGENRLRGGGGRRIDCHTGCSAGNRGCRCSGPHRQERRCPHQRQDQTDRRVAQTLMTVPA